MSCRLKANAEQLCFGIPLQQCESVVAIVNFVYTNSARQLSCSKEGA
jgi:hypothetical protein